MIIIADMLEYLMKDKEHYSKETKKIIAQFIIDYMIDNDRIV